MSKLKICRICLRTEAKGYKYERYQLKYFYEEVTALKVLEKDELPQWFCYECAAMLHKFHKFKEKCYIGLKFLKELLWKGPITYEAIYKLDHANKLQSTLKTVTITDKVKTFTIKDNGSDNIHENTKQRNEVEVEEYTHEYSEINNLVNDGKQIKRNTEHICKIIAGKVSDKEYIKTVNTQQTSNIDIEAESNLDKENASSDFKNVDDLATGCVSNLTTKNISDLDVRNVAIGIDNVFAKDENNMSADNSNKLESNSKNFNMTYNFEESNDDHNFCSNSTLFPSSPISILVQEDKVVNLKSEELKTSKSKNIELSNLKEFGKFLSEKYWKKIVLTEEEAVNEFRKKAEEPKYLDAMHKCTDCFKGFSKREMLNRHVQSRHSEDLGGHECRFCRMRFKWRCHLRKHIQQHYTKYECLWCHAIFHLDTSAILHEEYHTGTTKKCLHCNEEFRHITTYYTHMRTHRSAHVCVRCGASFVSRAGLRQHHRIKHPEEQTDSGSSESEGDVGGSYCARCDLRFHSRRAHTEHLFHSDMHAEGIKKEPDATTTKKIMGKRQRERITKGLRKRKCDQDEAAPVKTKRRKRVKRKHRKPSTCYQCGEEFSTQAACMKHHVAAHPRTSFHSPRDRHICELCGASLAPGSVAVHQNMHSRERVHACAACGRQFHSAVGLKRHLVTHTGEKPFACSLCEKRFTQSNSMKLHYRTFHLKQPYPKRIRKKKKDQSAELDDTNEEESDSVPETTLPEPEPNLPHTAPVPVVEDVPIPEVPAILHVAGENGLEEENMHYLTLN